MTLSLKQSIHAELLTLVSADLETLEAAHRATREAATHEEARPENDKDTRALEQSYLARGQAKRIEEVRAGKADLEAMTLRLFSESDRIAQGALVEVEEEGGGGAFFIAPYGGGARVATGRVQVVTPKSPLGRALLGRQKDDECEVTTGGKTRTLTVLRIS